MISSFIRRSKRSDYCADNVADASEQIAVADKALLKRVLANPCHTLYHLQPPHTVHTITNFQLQ
jgi:hypothetical protein